MGPGLGLELGVVLMVLVLGLGPWGLAHAALPEPDLRLGLGLELEPGLGVVGELVLGPGERSGDGVGAEGEGGAQWCAKASSGTCCHRCTVRWRGEENSAAAALQTLGEGAWGRGGGESGAEDARL